MLHAVKRLPDVLLDFRAATAGAWRLYRDASKLSLGTSPLAPDTTVTSFLEPAQVPAPPDLEFYRLKGLSPCRRQPGP